MLDTLYLECYSGISGDMLVGALLDLGASFERLQEELSRLPLDGYELKFGYEQKCGVRSGAFRVLLTDGTEGGHVHENQFCGTEGHAHKTHSHVAEGHVHEEYSHGTRGHVDETHCHGTEVHAHEEYSHGTEVHAHEEYSHGTGVHAHEEHSHGTGVYAHEEHAHGARSHTHESTGIVTTGTSGR